MRTRSIGFGAAACLLGYALATDVASGAKAADLEFIKSELRSIRELLDKQGRQIDALYRVVDAELNVEEKLKGAEEQQTVLLAKGVPFMSSETEVRAPATVFEYLNDRLTKASCVMRMSSGTLKSTSMKRVPRPCTVRSLSV